VRGQPVTRPGDVGLGGLKLGVEDGVNLLVDSVDLLLCKEKTKTYHLARASLTNGVRATGTDRDTLPVALPSSKQAAHIQAYVTLAGVRARFKAKK
jgi:hypothetical protein